MEGGRGCGNRKSGVEPPHSKIKKRAGRLRAPPEIFQSKWLQRLDVRRLQALGAADDFEFNRLAIVQRLIAISHDSGEMDENVLTALALDESKALAGVKPLHCSLFFAHCCVSFQELSYLVLRYVLAAFRGGIKQKSRKSYLADLYEFPKAIQEQQTQQKGTTITWRKASKIVSI